MHRQLTGCARLLPQAFHHVITLNALHKVSNVIAKKGPLEQPDHCHKSELEAVGHHHIAKPLIHKWLSTETNGYQTLEQHQNHTQI